MLKKMILAVALTAPAVASADPPDRKPMKEAPLLSPVEKIGAGLCWAGLGGVVVTGFIADPAVDLKLRLQNPSGNYGNQGEFEQDLAKYGKLRTATHVALIGSAGLYLAGAGMLIIPNLTVSRSGDATIVGVRGRF